MNDDIRLNLGMRIRKIREELGLSLRALAKRCNLSTNAISLIERGENSPTVSTLHRLATAFGVHITDFFDQRDESGIVHVQHNQRLAAGGDGIRMESLGIGLRNQQIEPFIVTILSDALNDAGPIVHSGQEFVLCIRGRVGYEIGAKSFELGSGDSLLFDASLPHRFWRIGKASAQILLTFQAGEGLQIARQRHLDAGYAG